jgi:tetratricopeptide (TPR) repeat protein
MEINPNLASIGWNSARLFLKKNKLVEALGVAKKTFNYFPEDVEGWGVLGACLRVNNKTQDSVKYLDKAISSNPRYAEAYINRGLIFITKDKRIEALSDLEIAFDLKPHIKQIWPILISLKTEFEDFNGAIKLLETVLKFDPNNEKNHLTIGFLYQRMGHLQSAIESYRRALKINPHNAEVYNNMGLAFRDKDDLESAFNCLKKAIEINPNFAEALNNLGVILKAQGELNLALDTYNEAINIKPDFSDALFNMGSIMQEIGELDSAIVVYQKALKFKPDYDDAYYNLGVALQTKGKLKEAIESFHKGYKKSKVRPFEASGRKVFALLPLGRSGSLFFHSLFDGHPEVSTLPGVYFKGWFGKKAWSIFEPDYNHVDWKSNLVNKIIEHYMPLFDASNKQNVIGLPFEKTEWLAKDSGFTEMGEGRNEALTLDPIKYKNMFLDLLKAYQKIDQVSCFDLIHEAFDLSFRRSTNQQKTTKVINFYHIHNPLPDEMIGFSKAYPNNQILYIVRNPVQSLESWMLTQRKGLISLQNWQKMTVFFHKMISDLLSPFNQTNSVGVRLEDIKSEPKKFIPKIAKLMDISDHESIYKSEFCNLKYWGPTSVKTGAISGFDTAAINQPIGRLFGARDIEILETLFWPFSHRFGYTELNEKEFKHQLNIVRPWLDEPMQFEQNLYRELDNDEVPLEELIPYRSLHNHMINAWDILLKDGTYKGMMKPLVNK